MDYRKLADKIMGLEIGEEFSFVINDQEIEITLGAKMIYEFDMEMVIMSAYGGGFEYCVWANDSAYSIDEVTNKLRKHFDGCELTKIYDYALD